MSAFGIFYHLMTVTWCVSDHLAIGRCVACMDPALPPVSVIITCDIPSVLVIAQYVNTDELCGKCLCETKAVYACCRQVPFSLNWHQDDSVITNIVWLWSCQAVWRWPAVTEALVIIAWKKERPIPKTTAPNHDTCAVGCIRYTTQYTLLQVSLYGNMRLRYWQGSKRVAMVKWALQNRKHRRTET